MKPSFTRRALLEAAGGAVAMAACARKGIGVAQMQRGPSGSDDPPGNGVPQGLIGRGPAPNEYVAPTGKPMPMRRLGRTGVEVSLMGLGAVDCLRYAMGLPVSVTITASTPSACCTRICTSRSDSSR